ncbi:MAG: GWxTD domain-containing protein [bacterium]|nr:GWxTD domain-containing protein [bacterium]
MSVRISPASVILLLLILVSGCSTRTLQMTAPPRSVVFDHRLEILNDGTPELLFELKIPLQNLVFRAVDGGFKSDFRITCQARSKDTDHVESLVLQESLTRDSFSACRSADDIFSKKFRLPLGPGEWEVEALIFTRKAVLPWRKFVKIDVPSPADGEFFLQGPFWMKVPTQMISQFPIRFDNSWHINEEAIHFVDGIDVRARVECRYLAWDDIARSGEMLVSLESRRGELAFYHREETTLADSQATMFWDIPVARLTPGPYLLRIEFITPEERREVIGQLDVGLTQAAFERSWEATLDFIRPIAQNEELAYLEDAEGESRLILWQNFWKIHDPNGEAPGNFLKESLCNRISEANRKFSSDSKPGYQSDRGQVYLELGPPDLVENHLDEISQRAIVIWKYVGLGRTYVFEGPYGMNSFSLIRVTG